MGIIRNPPDIVPKNICMPRWQRDWINSHYSINFSGLIQEIVIELIKQNDPIYYQNNESYHKNQVTKRRDVIESVLKNHPEIIPNAQ